MLLRLAWRNVWRNRRRSLVTIGAMTLALLVLVLYSGLVRGNIAAMEEDVVGLEVGDIQVFAPGYLDRASLYTRIAPATPLVQRLEAGGFAVSPRLLAGALAAHGQESAGVQLRGVDPVRDAAVSALHAHLARGSWLAPADPRGLVLGSRLAVTLGVHPGDELVLLGQAADGSMANDLFRVRGVLQDVSDATDRSAILMCDVEMRRFLTIPTGVHQLVLRRPAGMSLDSATAEAARLAPNETVRSWRQLMPMVASLLDSARGVVELVFLIVYVAVAILVLNAMLMAVFERIREFGILKAIGAGPGRVFALIMTEAAIEVALALLAGLLLSLPGMWLLTVKGVNVGALGGLSAMGVAMRPVWRGIYDAGSLAGPVIMLVVLSLLAALYPAGKAALVGPLDAMRHQ